VEADDLTLGLLGGGKISIGGKAKNLRATIRGQGDLDGQALNVEDAGISSDTAGTIGVAVRRSAKINASGPGDIQIAGDPACTVTQLGSGRVTCGKN